MKATQFFLGFGPRLWSFQRGETEYGVRAAAARRVRAHHRHEQPRRGAAGRRGAHVPPAELPAADARDHRRLADAHAASPSCCCSACSPSAASSSSAPGAEVGGVPGQRRRRPRRHRRPATSILSHRRRRRRRRRRPRRRPCAPHQPGDIVDGRRSSATASEQTVDGRRSARTPTTGEPLRHRAARRHARAAPPSGRTMSIGEAAASQRHRPVPGDVGVDQGRRQGAQPGQHRRATSPAQNDDLGDPPDHGRRHHPGQRHDRRRPTGSPAILYLLAALNVFVGVFNMFPLLPLDGGHAAIATYERIRERPRRPALLRRRRAS